MSRITSSSQNDIGRHSHISSQIFDESTGAVVTPGGGSVTISETAPESPATGSVWVQTLADGLDTGYSQAWAWTGEHWTPMGPKTYAEVGDDAGYQEWINSDESSAFYIDNSTANGGESTGGWYGPDDAVFSILISNLVAAVVTAENGLGVHFGNRLGPLIYRFVGDPSSDGYEAPIGSLLLDTTGMPWVKTDSGDTDWTQVGAGEVGVTPTLAEVLTAGGSTDNQTISSPEADGGFGAALAITGATPGTGQGGTAQLESGQGASGAAGGNVQLVTGAGDAGASSGASALLFGGAADGVTGGNAQMIAGLGSNEGGALVFQGGFGAAQGGYVQISGGTADGGTGAAIRLEGATGAGSGSITIDATYAVLPGVLLLNTATLPTSDPHNLGEVWSNLGVLTVSSG